MWRAQINVKNFERGMRQQLGKRLARHGIAYGKAAKNKHIRLRHTRFGGFAGLDFVLRAGVNNVVMRAAFVIQLHQYLASGELAVGLD